MMLSAIKETKLEAPLDQQIPVLEKMVQESQLEMRALLLHLRPLGLKDKSLGEGIKDLVIDLQKKVPMKVIHDIQDFKVPKGIEDHLFRITQEAISNTLRHSNGTKVTVELFNQQDYLLLRIQDNKGFNVDEKLEQSYGLKNMRERALEIGATFHIVSLPDSGTRIEVKAPLNRRMIIMTIKVLFVDDHEMVRIGISSYLSTQSDIEIVGEGNLVKMPLQKLMN